MAAVSSKVRPLIIREVINVINGLTHDAHRCNVCSKAGDDRFTWPTRESVLKTVSSFTRFYFDWNGNLKILKRRSAELCLFLEYKYLCVRDRVLTRYFNKVSSSKTSQPPNDVHVILIQFWNEEIRELVLWDRNVKDKFIRSLAKELVFSRIEAAVDTNCNSVDSSFSVCFDAKVPVVEEIIKPLAIDMTKLLPSFSTSFSCHFGLFGIIRVELAKFLDWKFLNERGSGHFKSISSFKATRCVLGVGINRSFNIFLTSFVKRVCQFAFLGLGSANFLECKFFSEIGSGHLNSISSFETTRCVLGVGINHSFCNLLTSFLKCVCQFKFLDLEVATFLECKFFSEIGSGHLNSISSFETTRCVLGVGINHSFCNLLTSFLKCVCQFKFLDLEVATFLECKFFSEIGSGHLNSMSSFEATRCVLGVRINRSFCNLLTSFLNCVCQFGFLGLGVAKFLERKFFSEIGSGHSNSISSFKETLCLLGVSIYCSLCNLLLTYFGAVCRLVFERVLDVFVLIVSEGRPGFQGVWFIGIFRINYIVFSFCKLAIRYWHTLLKLEAYRITLHFGILPDFQFKFWYIGQFILGLLLLHWPTLVVFLEDFVCIVIFDRGTMFVYCNFIILNENRFFEPP